MRSIGRILSVVIAVCGAAFGFICGYIIMQFEGVRASSAVKLSPLGLALLFALPGLLAFRDCNKRSKKQLSKFTTPVDENATDLGHRPLVAGSDEDAVVRVYDLQQHDRNNWT